MPDPLRDSAVVVSFKSALAAEGKSRCQVCRWKPPRGLIAIHEDASSMLHAHHVIPVSCGGDDHRRNLVLVCPTHHALAHKIGRMTRKGRRRSHWEGPSSPEQLLFELKLLEEEPGAFASYIAAGRDYGNTVASRRRSALRVTDTTNRTTRTVGEILARSTSDGVTADAAIG